MGLWLFGVVLLGVLVRCGAVEEQRASPDPAPPPAETEGSFAQIELRSSHRWVPPRGEPESRLNLFAAFVQHVGLEKSVARTHVGLTAAAPPLAPGECRTLGPPPAPPAPPAPAGDEGEEALLELLDAGALWIVLPQQSTLVQPTLYPDVLPHVSGVQYRTTLSTEGLSLQQVSVQGFGGADVGTFEWLRREGPGDFRIQQVAGAPPSEAPFAVLATSPLTLRWSPLGSEAEVRVRLRWRLRRGQRSLGIECRPVERGRHVFFPEDLVKALSGSAARDVTLQVVASHRETHRLPDGTPTTFLLSQSDSVLLTVTPY